MTPDSFAGRKVLAVGSGVIDIAREALAGADIQVTTPERLHGRWTGRDMTDLVLIDAGCAPAETLGAAISALGRAAAPPAAILVGAHLPAVLVRALLRVPRSDVLEAPFTAADLATAASTLIAPASPAGHAAQSRLWTVMGAVGGSGATTLAIEMACALAARSGRERGVALVDLNLADGAASAYLGAASNMMLSRASDSPERIDPALLGVFASPAPGGFDLLASARDPRGFARTTPEAVIRLLDVACQVYDVVVVDAPRHRHAWTLDLLAGSDEVVVISELTVPALLAARALVAEIEADIPAGATPRLVLNRLSKRLFGPAPSVSEAEKALQRKTDGGITSDWEAAAASVNLGGPISHHRPKSRIVKDVGDLVERMTAHPSQRGDANAKAAA